MSRAIEIDWDQLHELSGNDPAFEQELLWLFLEDSLQQVNHLQAACQQGDAKEIYQIAHHIKGASANVGATTLTKQALEIETAVVNSRLDTISGPVAKLDQEITRLKMYLEGK